MDKLIYTYAMIKSLYDIEEDYIDCFLPFIVKSYASDDSLSVKSIKNRVKEKYKLDIPVHVLNKILYRATQRDFLNKNSKLYSITKEGRDYQDNTETESEVSRRIRSLVNDMVNFFEKKSNNINYDQMMDLLCAFISNNIKILINFVNPTESEEIKYKKLDGNQINLVEYLEDAQKNKPDHYNTFKDMVLGSVISVTIYSKKADQLTNIKEKWFDCKIFLDTNFIFSLLGLHSENFNEPVQELFSLLKKNKFEIFVFDFTIDEINYVLNNFSKQSKRYPQGIKINTLYSILNENNWQKSDVIEFLTNLESNLKDLGISVIDTEIDITNFKPKKPENISKLEYYKPSKHRSSIAHDIAAIEQIKYYRKKTVRKFEDSIAIFLTSDTRLSKFNFIELGHKDKGTICEVILDKLLTNILWLKDPDADIPLKVIIESYSKNLFIKRSVWDKFYDVLQDMKQKDKIKSENVSMLFYKGYIGSVLIDYDDKDIDDIDENFILEEIEKAKELDQEQIKIIEEKEKVFLDGLENAENEKNRLLKSQTEKMTENFKKAAKKEADKKAKICVCTVLFLIVIFASVIIFKTYSFLKITQDIYLIIIYLSFIGIISGIFGFPKFEVYSKLHEKFSNRFYNSAFKKRLREQGVDISS